MSPRRIGIRQATRSPFGFRVGHVRDRGHINPAATSPRSAPWRRCTHDASHAQSRTGPMRHRPPVAGPAVRGRDDSVAIEAPMVRMTRRSGQRPVGSSSSSLLTERVGCCQRTIPGSLLTQPLLERNSNPFECHRSVTHRLVRFMSQLVALPLRGAYVLPGMKPQFNSSAARSVQRHGDQLPSLADFGWP